MCIIHQLRQTWTFPCEGEVSRCGQVPIGATAHWPTHLQPCKFARVHSLPHMSAVHTGAGRCCPLPAFPFHHSPVTTCACLCLFLHAVSACVCTTQPLGRGLAMPGAFAATQQWRNGGGACLAQVGDVVWVSGGQGPSEFIQEGLEPPGPPNLKWLPKDVRSVHTARC